MIRIFCGTEPKTKVAELVLEHSIRRNTKAEIEFIPMGDFDPWLVPKDVHQATGFSLRRFMIPEYCEFKGRAIYMDSDQMVLGDIQELWDRGDAVPKAVRLAFHPDKTSKDREDVPQTSVMVINCDTCNQRFWNRRWFFDYIRSKGKPHSGKAVVKAYQWIMHGHWFNTMEMTKRWNEFNHQQSNTKLIHFTFETQQPWYEPWHPLRFVWENELKSACEAGAVHRSHIEEGLKRGRQGSKDWRKYGGLHEHWKVALGWCAS